MPLKKLFYSTCSMIFSGIKASKRCTNETVIATQDKPAIVIFSRAHGSIIEYKVAHLLVATNRSIKEFIVFRLKDGKSGHYSIMN